MWKMYGANCATKSCFRKGIGMMYLEALRIFKVFVFAAYKITRTEVLRAKPNTSDAGELTRSA